MIEVKDKYVVRKTTNLNKKWERPDRISTAVKDAMIQKYIKVLELINLFGGFITIDHLYSLMKNEKTKKGVEYILKRLYENGVLNTYTINLNKDDQTDLKRKEFLILAFAKRTNKALNGIEKTIGKPTKVAILKQMYQTEYFGDRFEKALRTTYKKYFQSLKPEEQDQYIYKIFVEDSINDILKFDGIEQEKSLTQFGFYDQLTQNGREDRKTLREHFDNNAEILKTSEAFDEYKSSFTDFEKIDLNSKTTVLDFIKKHQYNNTIISTEAFNEYAAKEMEKAGYVHLLKEEKINRKYQEARLRIGRKIYNVKRDKKENWKQELYSLNMELKSYEKKAERANLKIIKKSLKWNQETKRYDIFQREEMDSLHRLRDLNAAITSFRIKDRKVYVNVDIYDIYYKPMSEKDIKEKMINAKYLLEALLSPYDKDEKKSLNIENDLVVKFDVRSFRGIDEGKGG